MIIPLLRRMAKFSETANQSRFVFLSVKIAVDSLLVEYAHVMQTYYNLWGGPLSIAIDSMPPVDLWELVIALTSFVVISVPIRMNYVE